MFLENFCFYVSSEVFFSGESNTTKGGAKRVKGFFTKREQRGFEGRRGKGGVVNCRERERERTKRKNTTRRDGIKLTERESVRREKHQARGVGERERESKRLKEVHKEGSRVVY